MDSQGFYICRLQNLHKLLPSLEASLFGKLVPSVLTVFCSVVIYLLLTPHLPIACNIVEPLVELALESDVERSTPLCSFTFRLAFVRGTSLIPIDSR